MLQGTFLNVLYFLPFIEFIHYLLECKNLVDVILQFKLYSVKLIDCPLFKVSDIIYIIPLTLKI